MKPYQEFTISDYQQGYVETTTDYCCVFCQETFDKEEIYPVDGAFFTAKKRMIQHITEHHGTVLSALLALPKEQTGLSESQQEILQLFAQDVSDTVIAQRLGISSSTVRNHRFKLKEKQRQATVFLSIMSLLQEPRCCRLTKGQRCLMIAMPLRLVKEKRSLLLILMKRGLSNSFPAKKKRKIVVLSVLAQKFDPKKNYSEAAVNDVLKQAITDYVTVRRYLIEYGFMQRTKDGKTYWLT